MRLLKLGVILWMACTQVLLGQVDSITYSLDLDSVFITSSASAGRVSSKLTTEQLLQNPVQNISSALNEISGVYMHTGTLNTNRITVRGIGNRTLFATNKLRAYIDDIPLTNGVGETTVEDFDREILHKAELYKGPGATAYGSGLGGLLLLSSKNATEESNYLQSKISLGNYNHIKTNQALSIQEGDYGLILQHGYQHSDGYRSNNSYDNRNYTLLGSASKENHDISLFVNHINILAQIPSGLNLDDFNEDPTKAAFAWGRVKGYEDYTKSVYGLAVKSQLSDRAIWKSSIYGNSYKGYESRPFNILDDQSNTIGLRSNIQYSFGGDRDARIYAGIELSTEKYEWDLYITEDGVQGEQFQKNIEDRQSIHVFTQYQMNLTDQLEVEIGLGINSTTYELDDDFDGDDQDLSGSFDYNWIASPRLNLKYAVSGNHRLYGLVSHGYSIPSIEETLTPDGVINTAIRPEIGWNTEIGYQGAMDGKWNYQVALYHMSVSDLLVARRTDADQFIGINAGGSRHIGAEIDLTYNLKRTADWKSDISLSYTYQNFKFTDFVDDQDDYSGNELTGTIPNQLSLGWSTRYRSLGLQLKYKYFDSMPMRDDNSVYSEAYGLMDVYADYTINFGKLNWSNSIGVNNVFDTSYASMILINAGSFGGNAPRYYYPGLPINFFGQTSVKYSF